MRQESLADNSFDKFRKQTRKEQFLTEMENIIPSQELTELRVRSSIAHPPAGLTETLNQTALQDYAKAVRWYRKAAEQGDAQAKLGFMYHEGQGVPQDYAKAAYWNRKAAEQDNVNAQYNLGQLYHEGQGVARANAPIIGLFFGCLQQIIILLLYRPLTVDLETAISA